MVQANANRTCPGRGAVCEPYHLTCHRDQKNSRFGEDEGQQEQVTVTERRKGSTLTPVQCRQSVILMNGTGPVG